MNDYTPPPPKMTSCTETCPGFFHLIHPVTLFTFQCRELRRGESPSVWSRDLPVLRGLSLSDLRGCQGGAELHLSLVSTISVSLMRASLSADGLSRLMCRMASWQ